MSINLHDIVRPAITFNKADSGFTVFRSTGQTNTRGVITATYARQDGYKGQFQSEGDSALYHAELGTQSTVIRKLYLYAPDDLKSRVWSVYRTQSRSGDYIRDEKGQYWLVTAVLEDFSECGWECVRVTLQSVKPSIKDAEGKDITIDPVPDTPDTPEDPKNPDDPENQDENSDTEGA